MGAGFCLQAGPAVVLCAVRYVALLLILAAGGAWADGVGVVAAEVGCGYAGGIGLGIVGIPVGNIFSSEEYAGGGLWGFILAYPAGVGLGTYAAGEIWGDDSENDWASAGAALGASYASSALGFLFGKYGGMLLGMLVAPAASAAAYNLVKNASGEAEVDPSGDAARRPTIYVGFAASF
jgi:hypothetical protein